MTQKILIVYPHNFLERTNGINQMFLEYAKYFKSRGFQIDLFALKNFESLWSSDIDRDLINQLYLYDFSLSQKPSLVNRFFHLHQKQGIPSSLPDYAFPSMKKMFRDILQKDDYKYILFGYVYWAKLLTGVTTSAKKIISINDWLTVQMKDYYHNKIDAPAYFKEELERVNLFDEAISISNLEFQIFSQLAQKPKHHLIPLFMESVPNLPTSTRPKYDIGFIGHQNVYNVEGINWFLQNVWPSIKNKKILIVGKIAQQITVRDPNITLIPHIENVADFYRDIKLTICPLFGGTGLKVKIIESLSYGVPVVTTTPGMVGFPHHSSNGCLIADTNVDFTESIKLILKDKKTHSSLSASAASYFQKYFSTKSAYLEMDQIFK